MKPCNPVGAAVTAADDGRLVEPILIALAVMAAVVVAGLWVLSPIDLLPELLPVIGPLDDVLVVAPALR